jgi:hypothetical protein
LDGDTVCRSWLESDDEGKTSLDAVERRSPWDADWVRADVLYADLLRDGKRIDEGEANRVLAERVPG